jgi:hypothetical protein
MQNLNRNFKRNFKDLQVRRLKNRLEEVKNIQIDLRSTLREQADLTTSSLHCISAEVGRWARRTAEKFAIQLA